MSPFQNMFVYVVIKRPIDKYGGKTTASFVPYHQLKGYKIEQLRLRVAHNTIQDIFFLFIIRDYSYQRSCQVASTCK